ncbi:hypothetical protein [Prauserella aidingensis]|uniref:hypothetical protein n=1 Tax=Prauserella aidingensis TaxID=387890 RepID=UPI0020A5E9FF|nr:hypothetical protein [Prauserella aidingensis]
MTYITDRRVGVTVSTVDYRTPATIRSTVRNSALDHRVDHAQRPLASGAAPGFRV